MWRHTKKKAIYKPRRKASKGVNPANTLTQDSRFHHREKEYFCCLSHPVVVLICFLLRPHFLFTHHWHLHKDNSFKQIKYFVFYLKLPIEENTVFVLLAVPTLQSQIIKIDGICHTVICLEDDKYLKLFSLLFELGTF